MKRSWFITVTLLLATGFLLWKVRSTASVDHPVQATVAAADHASDKGMSADEQLLSKAERLPAAQELSSRIQLPSIPFVNVTEESGLSFTHDRGHTSEYLLPETMGSGCAVIHLNDDDLPDVVFVNSQPRDSTAATKTTSSSGLSAWLNTGDLTFKDVTIDVGLDINACGMGIAAGDYDSDGDSDLYITCVGPNVLLQNNNGHFTDVTAESMTGGKGRSWSTSAGWFDYDNDGDLDLFVANYVAWDRELERVVDAITFQGEPRFGSPDAYPGDTPFLFRNDGAGKFSEVSSEAGLTDPTKSLGIAFVDANNDGRLDVFVANDGVADQLWLNSDGGAFIDNAIISGVAYSSTGAARAGMGIDIGYFRNDGSHAVAIGQYENEMTGLFVSTEDTMYQDEAMTSGLGQHSLPDLTWGVRFADFDLDGRLDLMTINGHVEQNDSHMFRPGRYLQSPALYWNAGMESPRELIPLTETHCGADLFQPTSGRAMAVADLDGDGDLDLITTSSGRSARVYRNDLTLSDHNWIRFRLVGANGNTDAIGAHVRLTADGITQRRLLSRARGYLSSGPAELTFGLGTATNVSAATITWPNGDNQSVDITQLNQVYVVEQRPDSTAASFDN